MSISDSDSFQNLAALNAMVSIATGSDAGHSSQIQAAIQFCHNQAEDPAPCFSRDSGVARAYADVVDRLVKFHIGDPESFGFGHWNIGSHAYDPLWIRAHLVRELKWIAGYQEALLLITGLRTALCPPGKYWTRKRSLRYREAIAYIEKLAVQYRTSNTKLSLLFV